MLNNSLFKSEKQDWETPDYLFQELDKEFHFDFDPCPKNPTFDGLLIDWGGVNFVNPPYRTSKEWIKKGFEEWKKGKIVVFLIPARTDTKAFHEFIYPYAEIRFIKGRIKFKGAKNSAPFPSMIAIFK